MSQIVLNKSLRASAEPWRSQDDRHETLPGRAPAPLNALIGRADELATLRQLFASGDSRLVTLTGPGGVGKTRLALALAADIGEAFGDTVAFVPLAPVRDATLVAAAIADCLDVQESGVRPLVEDVITRLRGGRFVLVLDNLEHLPDAAPLVTELLLACPDLRVLTTSRRRLGISGEHDVPVPPLALPDPARTYSVEEIAAVPAIRLFVARAQAAAPSFALTEANGRQVAEICQRLDGLPLAIELAAPRTRLLSPAALLSRLTNRLHLLTSGPRDVPERHQTMRQAIAWSYDLLDPETQSLLRRISVFVGGFTLDSAEAVSPASASASGHTSVLAQLTALVDESLVQVTEDPDGERRFEMLETVREYALERLEEAGEAANARWSHAAYYLRRVERADPLQFMPQDSLDRLQVEHDNVRAALSWSMAQAPETALRIVAGFWRFWWQRGYWSEGRGWLEQALAGAQDAPLLVRAAALSGAGAIADSQGDFAQAGAFFEESLALARESGDVRRTALAMRSLGIVASNQSEFDAAVALFEEALVQLRPLQDQAAIARCLNDLGLVAERRGDPGRAIAHYEEALPLAQAIGDPTFAALLLGNLAGAVIDTGDWARGEALSEEALIQCRAVGDLYGVASNLHNLADRFRERGELAGAWARHRESLVITGELGERQLLSRNLDRMAYLLTMSDLPRPAAHLLGASDAIRSDGGDTLFPREEEDFAETMAITRAALGDEAFQAAWDVGASLSPEGAVAEVLAIGLPPAFAEQHAALQAQLKLGLTTREVEVLHLVAAGRSDKEIASALAISRHTASKHVAAVRAKLHAPSRTGAVAAARAAGLL